MRVGEPWRAATPLPNPPPTKGRSRPSSTGYGGREQAECAARLVDNIGDRRRCRFFRCARRRVVAALVDTAAARRGPGAVDAWCSTATAGCCGPTPRRTAAGGCRRTSPTSIRAISRCCSPTRTSASAPIPASIRWRCCAPPASSSRNGRIVSGGSTLTMQVARLLEPRTDRTLRRQAPPDRCARSSSSARSSKDEILALYLDARALWRQSRRRARRLARLFRQGAEAAFARRGGAAGRAAAIARGAPARPLGRCRARARDRVLDRIAPAGISGRRDRAGQAETVPAARRADADARAACRRPGGRGGAGAARSIA